MSTLKSSLLSLTRADSFHFFGLYQLIACKGPSDMTPVRKRTIWQGRGDVRVQPTRATGCIGEVSAVSSTRIYD